MMKHLQKEVARLEAELRYDDSPSLKTLLVEKEQKIQQVSIYIYIYIYL